MSRTVTVKVPGGDFQLRRFVLEESLGRLYTAEADVLIAKVDQKLEDLLGKDVTVTFEDKAKRYWHGLVAEVAHAGALGKYSVYRLTLVPWMWFLTLTSDCRIFQEKTAPEIIEKLLKDLSFTDFALKLNKVYRKRDYCVQYRETAWAFISRLMEQEGIYFYTEHQNGKHLVQFVDQLSGHAPIPTCQPIKYSATAGARSPEARVHEWVPRASVKTGKVTLRDYDFIKPKMKIEALAMGKAAHPHAKMERYDYPSDVISEKDPRPPAIGKQYAEALLDSHGAQHERAHGISDASAMYAGGLIKLGEHPRGDQNREYLLVSCRHELVAGDYEGGGESGGAMKYSCSFEAMPSKLVFALPQTTETPFVAGLQTATCTGPMGEEIWTDEHGRVKVQFHWDREGKNDEKSSCWLRVSQPWAGKSWGTQFLPRVHDEVVVAFLEGDPDRPLVTGSVYNGVNKPIYTLPANKTQSGLKTRSSKMGGMMDFNELRFEDKKGMEHVFLQAQKDLIENVKNDHTADVLNNETLNVVGMRKRKVMKNEDVTIMGNQTTNVTGMHKIKTMTTMTLEATAMVTIKCGASSIQMTPASISIKSPIVLMEADGVMQAKAGGVLMLESGGVSLLKGAIVLIN